MKKFSKIFVKLVFCASDPSQYKLLVAPFVNKCYNIKDLLCAFIFFIMQKFPIEATFISMQCSGYNMPVTIHCIFFFVLMPEEFMQNVAKPRKCSVTLLLKNSSLVLKILVE